jgi:drug/metabolite transporter (DMT)-like permease
MKSQKKDHSLSVWTALGSVYVIWGSTYLAIRFAIESIPPFFMAGTRFITSGLILYVFARSTGAARPIGAHWKSAAIIASMGLEGRGKAGLEDMGRDRVGLSGYRFVGLFQR